MTQQSKHALMVIVALGFFAVLAGLMFVPVPTENREMLQMLLMPLSGAFGFLVGYRPPDSKQPGVNQ